MEDVALGVRHVYRRRAVGPPREHRTLVRAAAVDEPVLCERGEPELAFRGQVPEAAAPVNAVDGDERTRAYEKFAPARERHVDLYGIVGLYQSFVLFAVQPERRPEALALRRYSPPEHVLRKGVRRPLFYEADARDREARLGGGEQPRGERAEDYQKFFELPPASKTPQRI